MPEVTLAFVCKLICVDVSHVPPQVKNRVYLQDMRLLSTVVEMSRKTRKANWFSSQFLVTMSQVNCSR